MVQGEIACDIGWSRDAEGLSVAAKLGGVRCARLQLDDGERDGREQEGTGQREHRAEHQQPRDGQAAHRIGDHADHGIRGEDVAVPDQEQMGEAEDEQPGHAPVVCAGRAASARFGAPDHQQKRCAEQEGEEPAHPPVEQDEV
ncbi:hypothetical protein QU39_00240, partial [Staphylococcus aureus]